MSWGPSYKALLKIKEQTGITPKALESRPKLRQDLLPYLEAFYAVSAARQYSQAGVQPVMVSEVLAYLQCIGETSPTRREKYLRLIQKMDAVFLVDVFEKSKPTNARSL